MENVKSERGEERKPVLYVMGPSRPVDVTRGIILNGTNWDMLEEITGASDSEQWQGSQIVVYNDPKVMFGAKRVGGIRIRMPKAGTPKFTTAVEPEPEEPEETLTDDEVPF